MSIKCSICSHPRRLEIDRAIVKGGNLTKMAQNFGVQYYALYTHSREHIARQLSEAWHKKEIEADFDLLRKIDGIIAKTERIFERNYQAKKDGIALKALDSQRNTIQLLTQISFALHQAKITELEILKQKSGETRQDQKEQYQKDLQVLTFEELQVFQRLIDKMTYHTDEIIIPLKAISTGKTHQSSPKGKNIYTTGESTGETQETGKENPFVDDSHTDLVVFQVKPDTIPSTPRRRRKK